MSGQRVTQAPPDRAGCVGGLWLLLKLPFMVLRVIPHVGGILRGEAATDSGALDHPPFGRGDDARERRCAERPVPAMRRGPAGRGGRKLCVLPGPGMDRITVRLASVIAGAAGPGWQRTDGVTRFDWDFVRPAGQRTDPRAVLLPRTCADCGGPYRSDLDDACPYCHAARPDTEAGWCLDGMYLVVGT